MFLDLTPEFNAKFIYNSAVIFLLIILLILFVREIICWYWKINKQIKLQKRQIELQEIIADDLRDIKNMLAGYFNGENKNKKTEKKEEQNKEEKNIQ